LPEEALPLEAGEQDGPFGPGAALVLDGPGKSQQRDLAQDLRGKHGVATAQPGEDRRLGFHRLRGGLADGRLKTHPRGAQAHDRLDEGDITGVVTAMTAGQPVRPRESVPVFPASQRRRGHLRAPGQLADGQAVRQLGHGSWPLPSSKCRD
jgi:hypothetical protein